MTTDQPSAKTHILRCGERLIATKGFVGVGLAEILAAAGVPDFDPLWIDDDLGLQARYGERIPVLRREDSGGELDWPFDAAAVRGFIAG